VENIHATRQNSASCASPLAILLQRAADAGCGSVVTKLRPEGAETCGRIQPHLGILIP
jgi:hypothetical protein